jgi:hypothetical protein
MVNPQYAEGTPNGESDWFDYSAEGAGESG